MRPLTISSEKILEGEFNRGIAPCSDNITRMTSLTPL